MNSQAWVVELQQVVKKFNAGTPIETEVLHGIQLQLAAGEFCAVMGPSGSGKSTLLNLIGLLNRPSSGTLKIMGEDTTTLDDAGLTRLRGRAIGFIFQYHHLLSAFSAVENVMLPMAAQQGHTTPAMRERAMQLITDVGLAEWAQQPANRLSGGQQQRVAVARALALSPPLLLADEPTGNLDTKSADAVFAMMRRINREQGTSILFVTHNPELAARCDRTIMVVDGKIQA